jgi:cell division protein FtsQ
MAMERRNRGGRDWRRGRFLGLYVFLTVVVVLAAVAASCIIFFKVSTVEVYLRDADGNTASISHSKYYSEEEIVEASGVELGQNLLMLNKNQAIARILTRLPYIASVSMHKELPGTLSLTVTESEPVAAIQTGRQSWWLVDVNGKLLQQAAGSQSCMVVMGLTLVEPRSGEVIRVPDGTIGVTDGGNNVPPSQQLQRDSLLQLLHPLQDYDLQDKVRSVDLTSESELVLDYDGRLTVKIPLESDLDYNIKYFARILTDYVDVKWSKKDKGVLDMTYDDGHPHLTKN